MNVESNQNLDPFQIIPWEDILFSRILPLLKISDIMKCRIINKLWKKCINAFFRNSYCLRLGKHAPKCTSEAFQIMTAESECLRVLNLRGSKGWLNDDLLLPVIDHNPWLYYVDLTNSGHSLQLSLHSLVVSCRDLRYLYLRDCHWVTSDNVRLLALNGSELQALDIAGCWDVNDEAVSMLAKYCKKLKVLSLAKIYGLTDQCLSFIGRNAVSLEVLNLTGCWRITNYGVRFLGEYCKNLRSLQVKECRNVTEESLGRLRMRGVWVDRPTPPKTSLGLNGALLKLQV